MQIFFRDISLLPKVFVYVQCTRLNGPDEKDGHILLVILYGGNIFQGSNSDYAVNTINQRLDNAVDKLSLSPVDRLDTVGWIDFLGWCYISVIPFLCLNRQAHVVQSGVGWGGGQEYIVFCGQPMKRQEIDSRPFFSMEWLSLNLCVHPVK